ncbi:MAG: DUF5009 domain-containing protein [Deltaproteobacteria bacterium]|nr:DUF5009 domain-containing protein [Deltaproteobacteria bacterium]
MQRKSSAKDRAAPDAVAGLQRLQSLDVLRGLTIAAMILVNNPGSHVAVLRLFRHANWNGCHPADLIFPFFLFVVGAAIQLALGGRLRGKAPLPGLLWRVLRRTTLLFALGLMLNGFPSYDWSQIRVPGVLQRIALCYAAVAFLVVLLTPRQQILAAILILTVYAILMLSVPVPGFGPGVLRPGKDLASFVDRILLRGSDHLLFPHWDPEGPFSTLPAIATTLSGSLATAWLRAGGRRFWEFLATGSALILVALVLSPWLPINKSLWSSSYVFLTSGAAVIGLGVCHALVDGHGVRRWSRPWAALGANPIAIYMLSTLCDKLLLLWSIRLADGSVASAKRVAFEALLPYVSSPPMASFAYAAGYLLLWLGFAEWLYRRGVFLRL